MYKLAYYDQRDMFIGKAHGIALIKETDEGDNCVFTVNLPSRNFAGNSSIWV